MYKYLSYILVSLFLFTGSACASFFNDSVPSAWNIGFWPADKISWTFDESDVSADVLLADALDAVGEAFRTWNNVLSADYDFENIADLGGAYDFVDDPNWDWSFSNIVFGGWISGSDWNNLPGNPSNTNIAGTWPFTLREYDPVNGLYKDYIIDSDGRIDVNGDGYADLAQTVIFFNDTYTWGTDGSIDKYDIQTVATHEIGHALGLAHSPQGVPSVMKGNTDPGEIVHDLFAWDIEQVQTLYPMSAPVPEPGSMLLFMFAFMLKPIIKRIIR